MCLVAPFAPEFILMSQVSGIELVFGFLVIYYKPVIVKVQSFIEQVKIELSICEEAFKNMCIDSTKDLLYASFILFMRTSLNRLNCVCIYIFSTSLNVKWLSCEIYSLYKACCAIKNSFPVYCELTKRSVDLVILGVYSQFY